MATLENKIILIIGGTSGIGFGVAEASLKSLAQVVIVASSNKDRVQNAVKRLTEAKLGPGQIKGRVVDAEKEESIKALLEEVGEVDHLVVTSGRLSGSTGFPDINLESARSFFDARIWGLVAIAKSAKFRPAGSLTFTGGTLSLKPQPTFSFVSSIISGVEGLTRGLAVDLAPIRVNGICSGAVKTEMWDHLPQSLGEDLLNNTNRTLVKHVGMPDELAEAYLFCMKCSYVTGQYIVVDGGQLLNTLS